MKTRIFFSFLLISYFITFAGEIPTFHQNKDSKNMKTFSKNYGYDDMWHKIDSLVNRNFTQTALDHLEILYQKAHSENNTPQIIKAKIYKARLTDFREEDSYLKIFEGFEKEIQKAEPPLKNLLHSIKAELMWRYYSANRFRIMERTHTVGFDNNDIATWDVRTLVNAIIKEHLLALKNPEILKKTPVTDYELILSNSNTNHKQRPTLYDFITHRAIDFFAGEEPSLTRPADYFKIDKPAYFTVLKDFADTEIETTDTMSLKYYALSLYQSLTAFHLEREIGEALFDVELHRLKFVYQNAELSNKDTLFYNALLALEKEFQGKDQAAEAAFEIASLDYQRGQKYNPKISDDHKWAIKEAYERCIRAVSQYPNSFGAKNCQSLISRIEEKKIRLSTETFVPSEKPFFSLLTYKNISEAHFRIIETDYEDITKMVNNTSSREALLSKFVDMPYMHTSSTALINEGDYQRHTTEVAFPELKTGYYLLLVSDNDDFSYQIGDVGYAFVHVTDIAYISRRLVPEGYQFFVSDRAKGTPIKGATVETFYRSYNNRKRTYETKKWHTLKTNEQGMVEVLPGRSGEYRSFSVKITHKDDFIASPTSFYIYGSSRDRSEIARPHTFLFTDRAIYRPGQTVHFKGIILERTRDDSKILPDFTTVVGLYDVNNQKVGELELKSNEFGTFSGSFVIPTGLMTGAMTIRNESGSRRISVEEYKRPTFEVNFKKVEGSYRLNENINVKAHALAYAGNNVDGAEVRYRVVRHTRFPFRFLGWRWGFPTSPEVVIKTGHTSTDSNGIFEIDFTALPDKSVDKNLLPVFNYTVYADVTDITGETRSGQTQISVGYTALIIDIDMPEVIEKRDFESFNVKTTNLNGQAEPAVCQVNIYELTQPQTPFRKRMWEAPTKKTIPENLFRELFPVDEYENESNIENWEKGENVFNTTINTAKKNALALSGVHRWRSGKYLVEVVAEDAFGEEVVQKQYLTVFSRKDKKSPLNTVKWINFKNTSAEPGEKVVFSLGSAAKDICLMYEVEHGKGSIERQWVVLDNELKHFEIPVKEKHRGNFFVHITFVKDNRVYKTTQLITVPFTNKMLDIEFATFRDKLKPGEQEEWRIIIKDKKGDPVLAELLAAMYDASLDAFSKNHWLFNILSVNHSAFRWDSPLAFRTSSAAVFTLRERARHHIHSKSYSGLNWFGFHFHHFSRRHHYDIPRLAGRGAKVEQSIDEGALMTRVDDTAEVFHLDEETTGEKAMQDMQPSETADVGELPPVQVRTDFNETAFFYPHLQTNEKGEVVISFTVPESLTRWRIMALAHTKDLQSSFTEKSLVTQKELMAVANAPRFFREGDDIVFSARVTNISDKNLSGTAKLELFDALTMQPIDESLNNTSQTIEFMFNEGESTQLTWPLHIKEGTRAVTYRLTARAGNFSDGEERTVPVLSNRMLVTESLPLPIRGETTKDFTFDKLINADASPTLTHHRLTLEFTSNPAWYAIQALPYLIESTFESSEHIFSRYYANAIASYIANSNPKIKRVFDSWRTESPSALLSNLEKNQELKALFLEETPWLLNGKNETERKQRIALLFDLNKMSHEKDRAVRQLLQHQMSNGGWPWFKGMPDNRFITQHIVSGLGKLQHIGVDNWNTDRRQKDALERAVYYIDDRLREDYEELLNMVERGNRKIEDDNLSPIHIHYLYTRSFFKDIPVRSHNKEAFDYYYGQVEKYWPTKNRYQQGMIALALHRYGSTDEPADIVRALRENALLSEEMGMYWKENTGGLFWYQAPIETQALLIEVFEEVAGDRAAVDEMKVWLLKHKQTHDWRTTKATVEAIYALILRGTDQLASDELVRVKLGDMKIDPHKMDDVKVEAGTGYFKTSCSGGEIKPEMGNIQVEKVDEGIAWGAVYWQYFEQLDKITKHKTPLQLTKKMFVEEQTPSGKIIKPVSENTTLKVGDKLIVRIELRVDRAMEYVHMKDMRASGLEPLNVFSHYKFQDGLGYFESTRDAATHFFFSYLRRGTYVFEYPLFVTHRGDFSNGITTIQCMYAPEFTSHSEGIRIKVE